MNNTIKTILISLFFGGGAAILIGYLTNSTPKKIGVVDAVRLFDGYNMKKEMEEKAKVKLLELGRQVDSVGNLYNMAKAGKDENEIKRLAYASNYMKATLEAEYKKSNQEINQQVWKRLNIAMDAYGKDKGIHLIIGANGMGTVLYNDDYYDLTAEAIKFVNSKYEGGN